MTWDTSVPADSDFISLGDDVIREFKTDLETALNAQGSFPGADTSSPKYKWTPEYGPTSDRPTTELVTGQLYLNTEVKALQRYNGATWDDLRLTPDATVDENDLAASVAGDGLTGGAGTPLAVNPGTGLEISGDTIRIAAAAAGNGLTGGAGSALAVNPDGSTIEINSDQVRIKDGGVSLAKVASGVFAVPIINSSGLIIATSVDGVFGTVLSVSGRGALKGITLKHGRGGGLSGTSSFQIQITLDGVSYVVGNLTGSGGQVYSIHANPFSNASPPAITNYFEDPPTAAVGTASDFYFAFKSSLLIELRATSYTDGGNGFYVTTAYEG